MAERLIVMAVAAMLAACTVKAPQSAPPPAAAPVPTPAPLVSGLDLAGFDRSVLPQDDLYRFVGGAWLARTEIPPDRSNWGTGSIVVERTNARVRDLIVAASQQPNRAPGSDAQKAGDYYVAYMDAERAESLGLGPLRSELSRIDAIATPRDVAR
jgi:predicted metalloendopeptidase